MIRKALLLLVGGVLFSLGWFLGGQQSMPGLVGQAQADQLNITQTEMPCSKYLYRMKLFRVEGAQPSECIVFEFKNGPQESNWITGSPEMVLIF